MCRLPAPALEAVDAELARVMEHDHPGFRAEQGCCPRCREVYETLPVIPAASI
ncbi:MAG TPA: hypothetical protein VFM88_22205 [Vicinamibacteria bacterium]|nr:hypothetical protein [Vicinamibacteria bacterium]